MNEIVLELEVDAPAPRVWQAIVEPDQLRRWWSNIELEAWRGGRFREHWHDARGRAVLTSGEVLEINPPRHLRLSWTDDDWMHTTEVTVQLDPKGTGTLIRLLHRGWEVFPHKDALMKDHHHGWQAHLEALRDHIESTR